MLILAATAATPAVPAVPAIPATPTASRTDTVFAVDLGSRLDVENFSGVIAIQPWKKNSVRVEADHGERVRILVSRKGSSYYVRTQDRYRAKARVAYRIMAPPWMALKLEGIHCDVSVADWKSDVLAETVNGDVTLQGGLGLVRLSSVTGGVRVSGAKGRVQLSAVGEDVDVKDAEGEVTVEAVNGDVSMERIGARRVEAQSVNGDVRFTGWIDPGGRYRFSTHSGDLEVLLPPEPDATVSVSTFNGDFESAFPVRLAEAKSGREFKFTLGQGHALVDLESFAGTIRLRRGESSGR